MSIFTKERERDKDNVISDLQSELRRTQAKLLAESTRRAKAEANVVRMQKNVSKSLMVPSGDMDEGYECTTPGCWCKLEEDYKFCPGCGCEINWHYYDSWFVPSKSGGYDCLRDYEYDRALFTLGGDSSVH